MAESGVFMKNMSVNKKVFTGFAILIFFLMVTAAVGLFGAAYIERAYDPEGAAVMLRRLEVSISVTFLISLIISILVARWIALQIGPPIATLTEWLERSGADGDISLDSDRMAILEKYMGRRDEIGKAFTGYSHFMEHVNMISGELKYISKGQLDGMIYPKSEQDILAHSLKTMLKEFNRAFSELTAAAEQVATAASHVSDASGALAQGSTEQAAKAQELSTALADAMEITRKSDEDTDLSMEKNGTSIALMDKSKAYMTEMLEATQAIESSSQNIAMVIKVIDDIAFQTNILALNAAVEAARAGQHGRGFAVVSDEVRNLAAKSSEAAKETAALIEGDAVNVQKGALAVAQTNESLEAVSGSIRENSELVHEIADLIRELTADMAHIEASMEEINQVTQSNASTSEEAAATAQQLSAQASILNDIVLRFKLADKGKPQLGEKTPARAADLALSQM